QLDERPGSSLCAGQQPRWTSWCSSFPGPCPAVLPPWERRAPARWAAWLKPLCWPASSLDELVLVLPRPCPAVLPPGERRAPARWAAWFKPLCWPADSLDELVLFPPRVTPDYAIRVIALRKRSNESANITAPIRSRARKGFQTFSSPAPR